LVTPEKELLTLVDLSRVWIWIDVYERDIANVHVGDLADIHAPSLRDRAVTGTVTFIRPQVDPKTRRIGARVEVANPHGALKSGMFVRVDLRDPHQSAGTERRAAALVVPEPAILRDANGEVVFVEIEPRHYRRVAVRTGAKAEGYVEIVEGLEEATRVVVEGAPLLKAEASKAAMGGGHSH
jgi:RND family efflux transporter MFP subunit